MNNDRQITISAASSRKATRWPAQTTWWSELVERLKTPVRGTESLAEYLRLPKSRQDDLKDVGGFVGGSFAGEHRKANAVTGRDIITLDMDNIPPGGAEDVLRRIEALGCAYVVYSTRKHEATKPRLRLLVLLDRTATADEYEPLARKLAGIVGIELCDPSTFEASRLMYWPSCCADSQYVFAYGDKPLLDVDGVLAMFRDWHDITEWPQVPGVLQAHTRATAKQGDPTAKPGIVGAFCRVYDVYKAMETFIPDAYEPCLDFSGRFTYTGGSTTGGAVVYGDGAFLYSHHATDPVGGRLVNAFDLVRLHLFGDRDDDAKPDTPVNKMPSFLAMCELALADRSVASLVDRERYQRATQDFRAPQDLRASDGTAPGNGDASGSGSGPLDDEWMSLLERNPVTGAYAKSLRNIQIIMQNDPWLKGKIYKDTFSDCLMGEAPLPWGARKKTAGWFRWGDDDDHGLLIYVDRLLGTRTSNMIKTALLDHAAANQRNPVAEYMLGVEWDGVLRLDTLLIDYLKAEDCEYVRTVTRKAFVAAVARAMSDKPVKFDHVLVISGAQRIGKSTLLKKMGREWFSDSVKSFEGKEAEELIQGKLIIEIAETLALDKSGTNRIKQFLSKVDDQYRRAFGRYVTQQLRRCIFFGTTNDKTFLRDVTGNRRFWPVEVRADHEKHIFADKSPFKDLDAEIDQMWAEAVMRWRVAEPLYLSEEMEAEANRRREPHTERDPLQGQIEEFLDKPIPEDWDQWELSRRQMFWGGGHKSPAKLVQRTKVCAPEIWREALGEYKPMSRYDSLRVVEALRAIPAWKDAGVQRFGGGYGRQMGFRRTQPSTLTGPSPHPMPSQSGTSCQLTENSDVNRVNRENRVN